MQRHGDFYREHGYSFANELIVMSGHHGTHIDALGHVSVDGKMHGGIDVFESQRGTKGLQANDVAAIAPILTRGLLVDVARHRRQPQVPAGEEVTVNELDEILKEGGLALREGDAVLFRTGWSRLWGSRADFYPDDGAQPGPGEDLALCLAASKVGVVGSDTMVLECVKPGQNRMPVHRTLLIEAGIPIIEMLDLESLSSAGVQEFLFIALPLRIRGATGSPIRPVAIA
jgi:kynurenine formamidase